MFSNWKLGKHALAITLISIACITSAPAATLPAETWRKAVNQNAVSLQKGDYTNSLTASDRVLAEMVKYRLLAVVGG
jgi:hypothetical protein